MRTHIDTHFMMPCVWRTYEAMPACVRAFESVSRSRHQKSRHKTSQSLSGSNVNMVLCVGVLVSVVFASVAS